MEDRLQKWAPVFDNGGWKSGELTFSDVQSELELSLLMGRWAIEPEQREWGFWKFAELCWTTDPGSLQLVNETIYEWNPWAALIIQHAAAERYLSVGGASNGSKSHSTAGWGVFNWMCDPENTLVLCTSTSIGEAKKRIWGSVDKLLTPLIQAGIAPTRVTGRGTAFYRRPDGAIKDSAGLQVIAAAVGSDRKDTKKLVGTKSGPEIRRFPDGRVVVRPRLILIADELAELSAAIVEARSNLESQKFQMIAMSNPKSKFDPFGEASEPEDGWDSVDLLEDDTWRTRFGGVYIRLDGEKSPNILAGETIYEYLPTEEYMEANRKQYGESSAQYLRFCRATFYSSAASEGLYTMPEFRQAEVFRPKAKFKKGTERILAALDPSRGDEGDGTVLGFATFGYLEETSQPALEFGDLESLFSDDTNELLPRTYQIIRQVKDKCIRAGVEPDRFAVDGTMGDWADILILEWGYGVLAVNSNGAATERPLMVGSAKAGQTNKEYFADRSAELWLAMKPLLAHKQIFNLPAKAAEQYTTRGMKTGGRYGAGGKIGLEPKKDYRARTGSSPDEADVCGLLIDLAIERYGLLPGAARGSGVRDSGYGVPVAPPMKWFDMGGRSPESELEISGGVWWG